VAETLDVESGWERAVETALGDYLEAVCVDDLDGLAHALESFSKGRIAPRRRRERRWRKPRERR